MRSWLQLDAKNRSWRTILQGIGAVVMLPAAYAAYQVLQRAALDSMAGVPFDWRATAALAAVSAATAAFMAIEAYFHRLKLDPAPVPSAQPPRPPGTSEVQAPATAVVGPQIP